MTAQWKYNSRLRLDVLALQPTVRYDPNKASGNFKNQAQLYVVLPDSRQASASIFGNGSVNITGCNSMEQLEHSANAVTAFLKGAVAVLPNNVTIPAIECVAPKDLARSEICVVMRKADVQLCFKQLQLDITAALLAESFHVVYDPDKYCGVKVRVTPTAPLICLFRSGKAMVSAKATEAALRDLVRQVEDVLKANRAQVEPPLIVKSAGNDEEWARVGLRRKAESDTTIRREKLSNK
eukprot:CAMPEP_0114550290 /NCGR_PEP_ID=MMETSP0114-20121206/5994_1 /TAXON_ID=31324 /ORGANISM="Goniomonas sp, Strain m" /LENGTH=237 /DNA_ID=CAMNT_0001735053 /DNA_START=8 /DNA_END=722 /DNA_ORIENTATION=-